MIREHRGAGIEGVVDNSRIRAGSRALVLGDDVLPEWAERFVGCHTGQPILTVFLAVDGELKAIFVLGDDIRPDTPSAIARIRSAGVSRAIMVTGDDAVAAQAIGSALNLDAILADCSPAQKVEAVAAEKATLRR